MYTPTDIYLSKKVETLLTQGVHIQLMTLTALSLSQADPGLAPRKPDLHIKMRIKNK